MEIRVSFTIRFSFTGFGPRSILGCSQNALEIFSNIIKTRTLYKLENISKRLVIRAEPAHGKRSSTTYCCRLPKRAVLPPEKSSKSSSRSRFKITSRSPRTKLTWQRFSTREVLWTKLLKSGRVGLRCDRSFGCVCKRGWPLAEKRMSPKEGWPQNF